MSDNGCRDHCPCVGKTWGTIIDTHRETVAAARADADRLAEAGRILLSLLEDSLDADAITACGPMRHALSQHGSVSTEKTDRTASIPLKTPQASPQNGNAPDPEMGSTPDTPSVDVQRVRSTGPVGIVTPNVPVSAESVCDCGTVDCAKAALVVGLGPADFDKDDGGRV